MSFSPPSPPNLLIFPPAPPLWRLPEGCLPCLSLLWRVRLTPACVRVLLALFWALVSPCLGFGSQPPSGAAARSSAFAGFLLPLPPGCVGYPNFVKTLLPLFVVFVCLIQICVLVVQICVLLLCCVVLFL